jgi:tellurite resistance protein TehA-like permease
VSESDPEPDRMFVRRAGPRGSAGIKNADPGCFAVVMATGIMSRAVQLDGLGWLPGILLGAAIAAYLLLAVIYAWRLAVYGRAVRADAADPRRAFGFFTLAAGSDVLAAGLAADGHIVAAAVLLAIGGISWAALSYGLPMALVAGNVSRPALAGANGTWFLWAVATQSLAVGLTSLPSPVPQPVTALAVGCWAIGVMLYLLTAGLVAAALLTVPVRPAELRPPYWVFMGATAISVLAGAQILRLPPNPLQAAVHPVVAGLSVMLWAFGTWLIPLLVTAGIWRHVVRRVPLTYELGLWSIVFPVAMYGVGSHELGRALKVSWLVTLGRDEVWPALAIWAVVLLAMAWAPLRRPAQPAESGEPPSS